MSRILIVANWKMHLNTSQASLLIHRLQERVKIHRDIEVVLCPPMLTLQPLSMQIDRRKFRLGAQDAYHQDEGAFTGAVSVHMLRDLVHYIIIGHSERRHVFGETDEEVSKKVQACIRNDITPILCVGETKHERMQGETNQVIHDQLTVGLSGVTSSDLENLVIAYEPVWAIGTGDSANVSQISEVVSAIQQNLTALFGPRAAKRVRILYGGSVNPDVSRGYLDIKGIEGLLVGGASLNYHQFSDIVDSAYRAARDNA